MKKSREDSSLITLFANQVILLQNFQLHVQMYKPKVKSTINVFQAIPIHVF